MKDKIYITTPIFYVNDVPHIGHAYTSIICDTISRFYRLKNFDVKFLTGTDEHGQKVESAAKSKKMEVKDFVDNVSKNFLNLGKKLNISNTDFIRTTEERHKKSVQFFWKELERRDQIYKSYYEGWYSVKDEAFYQEKELKKIGDAFETFDGGKVDWIKEESYFFKLSGWENRLLEFYDNFPDFIKPESRRNEVINFVKNGLKDLSISRTSFKWGIKVPQKNAKNHIVYVWIDALVNYLTSIEYPDLKEESKLFWKNSIHIIGKDILKFHAIYWPAMLMSVNLPTPKKIYAHGWWTNEGKKISKSLKNTIDPAYLIEKFGLDQFKYYLLREVSLGEDGDFSEKSFINRTNSDLSNNFGNLIQRVIKFSNKNFENKFPNDINTKMDDFYLIELGYALYQKVENKMISFQFSKALEIIWNFISKLNQYIDKMEPWKLIKTNKEKSALVLSIVIENIRIIAILTQPFIPDSSKKILDMLNVDIDKRHFKYLNIKNSLKKNAIINEPVQIFPRYNE